MVSDQSRTRSREFPWGIEQRLAFIDFRLFWEERINRSQLIEYFRISTQQASADIQEYLRISGTTVIYDRSAKAYRPGEDFHPHFVSSSPNDYLNQLLIDDKARGAGVAFIGTPPPFATLPHLQRRIETSIFKAVLSSLRARQNLEVQYQSMNTSEPVSRWISPHSFGYDGFRWHVRAYCHRREEFRDFVLARILCTGQTKTSEVCAEDDTDWHDTITIRIGPHPRLSAAQRKAIELDYDMKMGETSFEVRAAFAFYVLQRLGLDLASEMKPAEARQIVLLNPDELANFRGLTSAGNSNNGLRTFG